MEKTNTSPFSQNYLSLDFFLTGGLSILVCLGAWAFMDKSASVFTVSQLSFALAFAINHPHFLSSYLLLYRDFRKDILKKKRYFFSAVVVPIVLGAALIAALVTKNAVIFGHIITGMFTLVGWHYVKQIFGFVIVSSAQRKVYYSAWERRILLTNLISVWAMSALVTHTSESPFEFYGIKHYGWGLPAWLQPASFWVVGITFLAVAWMQVQKYIREGAAIAPPALASFFALYAWYLPTTSHPAFAYLIPFFHSLQYLTFVWFMKRNQVQYDIHDLHDREWREAWVKKFVGFAVGALILGALFFEYLPKYLDTLNLFPNGELGSSPFLVTFLLFINIHHYFIDNAIWRSDNEVVKKHLMQGQSAPVKPREARRTVA